MYLHRCISTLPPALIPASPPPPPSKNPNLGGLAAWGELLTFSYFILVGRERRRSLPTWRATVSRKWDFRQSNLILQTLTPEAFAKGPQFAVREEKERERIHRQDAVRSTFPEENSRYPKERGRMKWPEEGKEASPCLKMEGEKRVRHINYCSLEVEF